MNGISNLLVKTDHFCDYVPVVSSITNSVDLFQKCVVLPFIDKATMESNHYYKHINEKSFVRSFLLVIPIIGNIIVGIYDFSKKKHDDAVVKDLARKKGETTQVEVRIDASSRPQDDSLENISKMTKQSMDMLCKSLKVNDRNDYIKCMLIFAIKAEKFQEGIVDIAFHDMIPYFQGNNQELKEFVHEDIAAGRGNQENTLLHEILKCKLISSKAKGSAFDFILRDGHEYLRDYFGERVVGEPNQWGVKPTNFHVVKWGDSLKKLFDTSSIEQKKEFFSLSKEAADRLKSFTGIEKQ